MMSLDIRTLILLNLVGSLVNLVAILVIWGHYRRRYAGLSWWLADMGLQVLAIILILLRGSIPDFVSIVVANVAVQVGILFLLVGLQRFFEIRSGHVLNLIFLAGFLGVFTYWGIVEPHLNHRDILLSGAMVWFLSQGLWLLLARIPRSQRPKARMAIIVLGGFVAVNLARIALQAVFPNTGTDFFQSKSVDGWAMLAYVTLSLFLVLSLVLLVTARLMEEVTLHEEKFTKAFHSAPNAILLTRVADGKIFEVNEGFEEITGYHRDEVLGKTTTELATWQSDEARQEFIGQLGQNGGRVRNLEQVFFRRGGSQLMGLVSAEVIQIAQEPCVISTIIDITEKHRLQKKLEELATHDALTGLANRRLLHDRFEIALSNTRRTRRRLAIISLDLDHFKEVNDQWGHETGDQVLIEAARRLSSCLRGVDTVARFGGDEFVLLLWEVAEAADASRIALKVLEQFQIPFQVGSQELTLHASLGIALYPDTGSDLATLLRKSDDALYEVKETGRNNFRFAVAP